MCVSALQPQVNQKIYTKMKKITNTTKKTTKPGIVMNCTNLTCGRDVYTEYIAAKVRAGKPITSEELEFAKDAAVSEVFDGISETIVNTILSIPCHTYEVTNGEKLVFDEKGNVSVKKPNIFKRLWNKLKYAFTW